MKYGHILDYVVRTPWAILPEKMEQILSVLSMRVAGDRFSAEEIQARIGDPQPPTSSKRGAIAVLPLRGVIAHRIGAMDDASGGMSTERFVGMLRAAVADPSIGTIVLDVNSPGGTVPGVMEAAVEVYAARESKKIVAVANSMMASAAYWIASQAHEIVGIPSAFEPSIGSIGAFVVHRDLSEALAKEGVKITLISAGKHKVDGFPSEPLSDEHKARMQAMVDAAYAQFTKDVARGRGVSVADVRAGYGEGMALGSKEAKAAGLIDRIATMDETLARLSGRSSAGVGAMRAEADLADAMVASDLDRANEILINGAADETPSGFMSATDDELRERLDRF